MAAKKKKGAPVLQVTEPTKDVLDAFEFKSNFLLNNPYFDFKEIGKDFCAPERQRQMAVRSRTMRSL